MGISCLEKGHGLLPPEFEHLLSTLTEEQRTQSAGNTLVLSPLRHASRHMLQDEHVRKSFCVCVVCVRVSVVGGCIAHVPSAVVSSVCTFGCEEEG